MKLFFAPPTHGASKLYEAAFGEHHGDNGVFLLKGRVTELPFQDQAGQVLERVQEIYEQEFGLI